MVYEAAMISLLELVFQSPDIIRILTVHSKEEDDLGHTVGSRSHGRKTIMIYDESEQKWKVETPKAEEDAVPKDLAPGKRYAFKFIEYYQGKSSHRVYSRSGVEIFSKELIQILDKTLKPARGQIWDDTVGSLRSPYKSIVYSWDKLIGQTVASEGSHMPEPSPESEKAKEGRDALADLLECIRNDRELQDYFKTRDTNNARLVTSNRYLWTLFPPATMLVASPFVATRQLFLLQDIKHVEPSRYNNGESYWRVSCIYLDFDTSFCRRTVSFKVKDFEDTKPINTLECYPTRFMEDEENFLKLREEQGKKFKTFCFGLKGAAKLFSYHGNAISSGIGLNKGQQRLRRSRSVMIQPLSSLLVLTD